MTFEMSLGDRNRTELKTPKSEDSEVNSWLEEGECSEPGIPFYPNSVIISKPLRKAILIEADKV